MKVSQPEQNQKMPPSGNRKYPFRELELGASFLVVAEAGEDIEKIYSRVRCSCSANSVYDMETLQRLKFKARRVTEGIRVWRVE